MPSQGTKEMWIPARGWVPVDDVTAEDLLARRDSMWAGHRPEETLKGISGAKRPQLARGTDCRDLEEAIAQSSSLGSPQRKQMLQELRALAAWFVAAKEDDPDAV